jgi:hypothetical protein
VPSIPVALDIECSAVSFRVMRTFQLTRLSRLTLIQAAAFAPTQLEEPVNLRAIPLVPPMELRPSQSGSLTLSSLTIPQGALVTVQRAADEGTWRLGLEHPQSSVAATLAGQVTVSAAMLPPTTIDFGRGASLVIRPEAPPPGRLELDVTPLDERSFLADVPIDVDHMSFVEIEEEPSAGDLGIRRVRASSVLGGSTFNHSLGGRETRLMKRASVDIDVIHGQISELRLERSALHIAASGSVRELHVGIQGEQVSLRPSWLEWLTQNHALQMVWGAAAWLLALLIGGMRWWRTFDFD